MILIPIKWLFHWEYTQHFQTNPGRLDGAHGRFQLLPFSSKVATLGSDRSDRAVFSFRLSRPMATMAERDAMDMSSDMEWNPWTCHLEVS